MSKLLKGGAFVGILLVAFYFTIMIASESGEVVVLKTSAADGSDKRTRLWVVDHEGHAWLRGGASTSRWLKRLRQMPAITIDRGGDVIEARASVDESATETVNALMREKYGWADVYIDLIFGRDDAIAVRLDPL